MTSGFGLKHVARTALKLCSGAHIIHCSSPSRDKASRMLRQAVAKSAMDCHSSSVESAVSDRTATKTPGAQTDVQYKYSIYAYTVYYHCLNQGANFLQSIILIIMHVMHA